MRICTFHGAGAVMLDAENAGSLRFVISRMILLLASRICARYFVCTATCWSERAPEQLRFALVREQKSVGGSNAGTVTVTGSLSGPKIPQFPSSV